MTIDYCKAQLHLMTSNNYRIRRNDGTRECIHCKRYRERERKHNKFANNTTAEQQINRMLKFPSLPYIGQQDWRNRAACASPYVDPEAFYDATRYSEAMEACARCPLAVKRQCLDYGMNEKWGIFGGMTPNERTALKREQKRDPNINPRSAYVNSDKELAAKLYESGMDYKDVARQIGIPKNTVYSWLKRPMESQERTQMIHAMLAKGCRISYIARVLDVNLRSVHYLKKQRLD